MASDVHGHIGESSASSHTGSLHSFFDAKHMEERMSIDQQVSYRRGRYMFFLSFNYIIIKSEEEEFWKL